jgi:hypothetical protein
VAWLLAATSLITTGVDTALVAVATTNQTIGWVGRTPAVATIAVATTDQMILRVAVVTNAISSPVMSTDVYRVVVNLV